MQTGFPLSIRQVALSRIEREQQAAKGRKSVSSATSSSKDGEPQTDRPPIIQGNYQNTDVQQNDLALRGNRDSLVQLDVSNDNFSQTVSDDSTSASTPVDLTVDADEFGSGEERV